MADSAPLVVAEGLRFDFRQEGFGLDVPSLAIEAGEHIALIGPSGSGKTTLLHLLTGILHPRAGSVFLHGQALEPLGDAARRRKRLSEVGMIFQEFELLPYLTALENILLPYLISGGLPGRAAARQRALDLAERAGVSHTLKRKPARLSQGERQRIAICRALITAPKLLIGDEPTGNLDPKTARQVVDLLFEEARTANAALLVVTHDHSLIDRFDRTLDIAAFHPEDTP